MTAAGLRHRDSSNCSERNLPRRVESKEHVERLKQAFEMLEEKPKAKPCKNWKRKKFRIER